jgi:phospholipase/carboxylesterase
MSTSTEGALIEDASPLAYRLSKPSGDARRLLVLCHGVGGNETNLAPLAANAPRDTAVVLARAPLTLGPGQYAWFPVAFGPQGPRPDFAAAESSRERLAAFVEHMQSTLGIAPTRTVIAGFSQGGIMSASVALTRPERVAGFAVLAGRILPELEPRIAPADALRHLRGFIGHGRDDSKLPVDWAHRADAWLTRLGVEHETHLYPGDHGIAPAMQADVLAWFDRVAS